MVLGLLTFPSPLSLLDEAEVGVEEQGGAQIAV